jgi:hypothetical protein
MYAYQLLVFTARQEHNGVDLENVNIMHFRNSGKPNSQIA